MSNPNPNYVHVTKYGEVPNSNSEMLHYVAEGVVLTSKDEVSNPSPNYVHVNMDRSNKVIDSNPGKTYVSLLVINEQVSTSNSSILVSRNSASSTIQMGNTTFQIIRKSHMFQIWGIKLPST